MQLMITSKQPITNRDNIMESAGGNHREDDNRKHNNDGL
jgi:hypothetical protein